MAARAGAGLVEEEVGGVLAVDLGDSKSSVTLSSDISLELDLGNGNSVARQRDEAAAATKAGSAGDRIGVESHVAVVTGVEDVGNKVGLEVILVFVAVVGNIVANTLQVGIDVMGRESVVGRGVCLVVGITLPVKVRADGVQEVEGILATNRD